MTKLACLAFVLVSLAGTAASAQSLYLPNGASGVAAAAGVRTNDDALAVSVTGGYSYQTFLDGGLSVHGYAYDNTGFRDVTAIGVQPYATVHLLRQNAQIPISLAGTVNYQQLFFRVNDNSADISGWSMFVGGYAYRRLELSGPWSVTPQLTLGYDYSHIVGGTGIVTRAPWTGSPTIQLAGNLAYLDRGGRIWLANPFVAFDSRQATFGLAIGATFPVRLGAARQ
jgi:hypothetical protein